MALWAHDDIDLGGPAVIEFDRDQTGGFRFIAVEGSMDCRYEDRDGRPSVEFTWTGFDEGDEVGGRGWAVLEQDGSLRGHLFFHLGDDSSFRALRMNTRQAARRRVGPD